MIAATRDLFLPTAMVGSYPRPRWFDRSLTGRDFRLALGDDELFREQYLDALATYMSDQDRAGLDIFTDGDARFDLSVGGKAWFFYALERLGGIGSRQPTEGWSRFNLQPGHILWEVQEAYQAGRVVERLARGPLRYADLWRVAQRMTAKPVKFGTISATTLAAFLRNEHYPTDRELLFDLCDILNAELRALAAAGCPVVQIEEPRHHYLAIQPGVSAAVLDLETEAFNRQVRGVNAEIWAHSCWGNPNQQRLYWNVPSYEPALDAMLQMDADVITFECASSDGRDFAALGRQRTDKKIGIGVVSHTTTTVEPPAVVAGLIRRALEHFPPERLVLTPDCGFGREGISRRIAFYKCVSLVQATNTIRRELGRPAAPVRAADPRLSFDYQPHERPA